MDFMPSGVSLALYAITSVCGAVLLTLWFLSNRNQRNVGFASKADLKRQLSAKTVLKATEIRPSLEDVPVRTSAVSLAKNHSAGS
ncbi:hypothetical protein OG204_18660 [Streptomyces sp. NBC_01387]|uniref:hypothetical protein n=1 Tax=unclassified Streptomyces TaxID=2593676 RepID=UPI0022507E91|nr:MULTISPECIES: hypothetical protein [unclassified Streptomyces]MCX4549623.1 hypothetical protein [Streptomyces sp. NBC_01500]WSC21153.1 hypothetical protein OIE60_16495 [Streptomyces sp. NBC_01766]